MAYAILFRKKGTDGSLPEHWSNSFQSGDTSTRRNQIDILVANPQNWEVVPCTEQEYAHIRDDIKFKAERDAEKAVKAVVESAYIKYKSFLKEQTAKMSDLMVTQMGLTQQEADELLKILKGN